MTGEWDNCGQWCGGSEAWKKIHTRNKGRLCRTILDRCEVRGVANVFATELIRTHPSSERDEIFIT